MAKCNLELCDPKFVVLGNASPADLKSGLKELKNKVAKDHKLAHFFNQPMQGFPDFQNKVWKWDFAPAGDKSATRKGWRLLAFVPDPNAPEPILARAFLCYDKDQDTKGNRTEHIAKALKEFLSQAIKIESTPDRFRRQPHKDGIISLCYECYESILSPDEQEADNAESAHECAAK